MMKKKILVITVLLCVMSFLFGCGESFPELTEEEYNQTVEFAVGLLMKYSNNDQSKLTKVNVKELQKQREKEARAAAEKERKDAETSASQSASTKTTTPVTTQPEKKEDVKEEPKEQTVAGAEETTSSEDVATNEEQKLSSDDMANAESSEKDTSAEEKENTSQSNTVNPNALVLNSEYSLEVSDDIFLSYQGYSVSSTFPESSKSYVINADKGKKLLVLRFDLYNASESVKKVNMIDKGILIQTLLNGKNLGYNAVTFLPNDLTSYVGTIDSKARESLVVLSEIDAEDSTSIQTLGMIVTIGGKEQEVSLQ